MHAAGSVSNKSKSIVGAALSYIWVWENVDPGYEITVVLQGGAAGSVPTELVLLIYLHIDDSSLVGVSTTFPFDRIAKY